MNTAKISTLSLVAMVGVALAALVFSIQAEAGTTMAICHVTSSDKNPVIELVISDNALQTHLDHGDILYSSVTGCSADDGGGPDPV